MLEQSYQIISSLKNENKELLEEIKILTQERDEARKVAEAISHMLTYAAEKANRHGLMSVTNGDGELWRFKIN